MSSEVGLRLSQGTQGKVKNTAPPWWALGKFLREGNGEILIKGYKLPVRSFLHFGDLIDSTVSLVNNTAFYTWKLLREQIFSVLTTEHKRWLYDVMEVLTNTVAVIISQHACIRSTCHASYNWYNIVSVYLNRTLGETIRYPSSPPKQ